MNINLPAFSIFSGTIPDNYIRNSDLRIEIALANLNGTNDQQLRLDPSRVTVLSFVNICEEIKANYSGYLSSVALFVTFQVISTLMFSSFNILKYFICVYRITNAYNNGTLYVRPYGFWQLASRQQMMELISAERIELIFYSSAIGFVMFIIQISAMCEQIMDWYEELYKRALIDRNLVQIETSLNRLNLLNVEEDDDNYRDPLTFESIPKDAVNYPRYIHAQRHVFSMTSVLRKLKQENSYRISMMHQGAMNRLEWNQLMENLAANLAVDSEDLDRVLQISDQTEKELALIRIIPSAVLDHSIDGTTIRDIILN